MEDRKLYELTNENDELKARMCEKDSLIEKLTSDEHNNKIIKEYLGNSIQNLKIAIGEYVIRCYHENREYNKEQLDDYANENVILKVMLDSLK